MMEAGLLEKEKRPYKVCVRLYMKAGSGAIADCRKLFLVDAYDTNQENRRQAETPS
jgi:hypothetical protein